jgi:hypothetical protein
VLSASLLLLGSGAASAQQQINLTAGPATATLPDGTTVPMWGYTCGTKVTGSLATCFALNAAAAAPAPATPWSPVVITVPSGQDLRINLTNQLSFPTGTGSPNNAVPTSLVIVGQVGGGLGTGATYTPSPAHAPQGVTWSIPGDTSGAAFNPPAQGKRVQSFATEVAPGAVSTSLTWSAPRPGTYLLESGTHPSIQGPMGLYGIVVVTCSPADTSGTCTPGTAYPGVTYGAEVPLLLSEIDPNQNEAVQVAVTTAGFSETSARVLRDTVTGVAPTLDASGNPIAGSGYKVGDTVTFLPTTACVVPLANGQVTQVDSNGAITAVTFTGGQQCSQIPNATVNTATGTGASLTAALSLAGTMCSDGAKACYPPAVNYTPLYYLVNGAAFDKTNPATSLFSAVPGTASQPVSSGGVLVRLVNAGLRMHVPSIVGTTTGAKGAAGMSLVAEDGNVLPGVPRVQSEVFMAAGKTVDVMINPPQPASGVAPAALAIYDRELSLSANRTARDGGMLAYIGVNGGQPAAGGKGAAVARNDAYNAVFPCASAPCRTLTVSDPARGVIANDTNVYGVQVLTGPKKGTLSLNADGTFAYTPNAGWASPDTFQYQANGNPSIHATVTLSAANMELASGITLADNMFVSNVATRLSIKPPGILAGSADAAGYPLTVATASVAAGPSNGIAPCSATLATNCVTVDSSGAFNASVTASGTYTFTFKAQNSQGTVSAATATVMLTFSAPTGLAVTVLDGADKTTKLTDYRWIIEEDRTFYVDPNCTKNPLPAGCPAVTPQGAPAVFGTNFHTSHMPVVATGCTGPLSCESGQTLQSKPAVCDVGNGVCRTTGTQETPVDPKQVSLDPRKRYYISVLPGDAANPFNAAYASAPDCSAAGRAAGSCGHGMGGAPIGKGQTSVMVLTQPSPYPPAKLTVFVFEDDFPLNGEHDAGGGIDVLSPNEPGLGNFQITLFDDAGGTGDATGQPTYDMFNMPLTNSLAGTIDPVTGLDACPISPVVTTNVLQSGPVATPAQCTADPTLKGCQKGIVGMIVTCPTYESDGTTLSPLAGQAVVNNLYQGRYGVVATPGADRIARGEEWLQTNTLDGQKAHDSFMRIGEPAYFQEYGPAGYHVSIGFANPKIIRDRKPGLCATPSADCTHEIKGHVTMARMSRVPDERLYGSGTRDAFAFTQCYVSLGDPDGADFDFQKCADDGSFDFTGVPPGNWKLTIFDQWNDQIVDGIMQPVAVAGTAPIDMGEIATHQWQSNIYTRTFFDANGNGVSDHDTRGVPCTAPNVPVGCNPTFGNDLETGLTLVATNIRFRDGSFSNFNNTDLNGYANFNEVFPLFSWYTIETDSTRYKTTGVHVVYDSGGPVDGSSPGGTACSTSGSNPRCGSSSIGQNFANTYEPYPLPSNLSVPGAVYCAEGADCATSAASFAAGTQVPSQTTNHSTGRIDPPFWFGSYGWQGFSGQNSFLEFGKKPYVAGETGGIHGHVVYASTRPFDDPQLLLQTSWEPLVPHVRINLYKEDVGADGATQTLTLIDHTETSSFDDWAQGFRSDGIPNMNCPGQSGLDSLGHAIDPFFFSLQNQPQWLDIYNNGAGNTTVLPNNSQFKCYDGMHNWNQLQPAPYDGLYTFPSVTGFDPKTGRPSGTNCTACTTNPDSTDRYRFGTPMLPAGKYVVEVVVPPGYELVKEEDKNILIGDNFIAPVTQQFAGLGNVFILPDQAEISSACNGTSAPQNPTCSLGRASSLPSHEGDTGSVESFWPCVGARRTVPDFISLYPQSAEISPFAGAVRPLCDRKEVTLTDQSAALAKFYIFTSAHTASHFTGVITDDFTAEFDPFSPQFGEKFAPAYLPVSIKDWTGNEISRVYADQWGAYNGLSYSTWEVNPPNPTGYGPTMMVLCMNDSGSGTVSPPWDPAAAGTTSKTPDPLFQPQYSQFCYELPFMPGQTGYFDTPVVPNTAFSEGYNHPDCNYADATPAIKSVIGDVAGPWVSATGHSITITALGNLLVDNYGYSGPSVTTSPFNIQKITRHYGFGATKGTVSLVSPPNAAGTTTTATIPPGQVTTWTDGTITANIPNSLGSAFNCPVQQQSAYKPPGTATAMCAQLVITAANGKKSVDTVTVTIGGKKPTVLAAGRTVQSAIDAAMPGDLIIVPPGAYHELLLMWKPVRLQGVGAASTIIDANAHPAGLLDPWRRQVGCLFGLSPDGRPADPNDPNQATAYAAWQASCLNNGYAYFYGGPYFPTMVVDRVPAEGILGWDTTLNGNLAEQLIEPSLMGAYEGAAITVLAKGVFIPKGSANAWGSGAEAAFPDGSSLLRNGNCTWGSTTRPPGAPPTPYPTNFYCNPSSIDGLGVTNSSQGGGGIFVHAWGHELQIANNRVYSNTGTLSGGITVGQGEHIDLPLGGTGVTNLPPGSCETSSVTNLGLPYCYNYAVNVHHNAVTMNSSMGDELFSSTPAGAGGVSLSNGSDYYRFTNNWVCGNLSTGDGGGVAHIGWSKNGLIDSNSILFNQSTNPTITTNGGGLLVMGAPDPDPTCATNNDKDCVPPPGDIGPSDGTGPGLVINANLIMGNSADSGSGGGLRLQHVNGSDLVNFPNGVAACLSIRSIDLATPACDWNSVSVTNNIIANNVAGWDGAGVSLQDALAVNIVNNTIISNDSTASSGVLFGSLFAPLASSPGTNCTANNGSNSCPQVAGLVSVTNSPVLQANLPATGFSCPIGHGSPSAAIPGTSCRSYSVPQLLNDVIWQNRSFAIGVGGFGPGAQNQQKLVALLNAFSATPTPAPSQPSADAITPNGGGVIITGGTGACVPGVSYWDIGVRGDKGPGDHSSGFTLSPSYSFLDDFADYPGANNTGANPTVLSQYCNGSRVPPELGSMGYQVPPGTNETNALPTPVFSLTPAATVDEGNNWINLRWGPLATTNPSTGEVLGNYSPATGSPVIGYVSTTASTYALAPSTDFYGNPRKSAPGRSVDAGAVEFVASLIATTAAVSPSPLAFGNWASGTTSNARTLTVTNTGTVALAGGTFTFGGGSPQPFSRPAGAAGGTCGASLAPGASCTVNVVFAPATATSFTRSLTVAYGGGATVTPSSVTLTGTGVVARAPVAITPNPLTITLASGVTSGTGTVTLRNTAAASGSQVTVASVAFSGGSSSTFSFSLVPGQDLCTGATLAPGGTCTVGVRFQNLGSPSGSGTITFTDNGAGSPQTGNLSGSTAPAVAAAP